MPHNPGTSHVATSLQDRTEDHFEWTGYARFFTQHHEVVLCCDYEDGPYHTAILWDGSTRPCTPAEAWLHLEPSEKAAWLDRHAREFGSAPTEPTLDECLLPKGAERYI